MKKIKMLLSWMLAIAIGFSFVNLLCFAYERPVGWIETPNGPCPAGRNPQTFLVHGTEGYGIIKVDENGYINPEGSLQEPYVLCMGSSHTQGKEVPSGEQYTALVNDYFSKEQGSLTAYNIACDGNYLPSLIKHFSAAIEAFPNAAVVTMEISSVDFSAAELEDALDQVEYDETQSVKNQVQNMGTKDRFIMRIKEYFPLLGLIKSKIETASANAAVAEECDNNHDAAAALEEALKLVRSQFDGEIIVIYHSTPRIENDGSISFAEDKMFEVFKNSCDENGIQLLDVRTVFLEHYEQYKELPYGFSNTKPASGHLNKTGHRLVAQTLIPYIKEGVA